MESADGGTLQPFGSFDAYNWSSSASAVSSGQNNAVPLTDDLEQNYPDPFNPTTTISYELSTNCHVTLKVYDLLSRELVTLVDEQKNAGDYKVTLDGNRLASGVYFYRLQAGAYSVTKKLLLLK